MVLANNVFQSSFGVYYILVVLALQDKGCRCVSVNQHLDTLAIHQAVGVVTLGEVFVPRICHHVSEVLVHQIVVVVGPYDFDECSVVFILGVHFLTATQPDISLVELVGFGTSMQVRYKLIRVDIPA